jgi:hypothetical protein
MLIVPLRPRFSPLVKTYVNVIALQLLKTIDADVIE